MWRYKTLFDKLKKWFSKAWDWIQALWEKHDEVLSEMVREVLPMVIEVAFRNDLSGEEKKKVIVDVILDNAENTAGKISKSMLNEAIEIAANKYNIQIGKLTIDKIDGAREAVLSASRKFANGEFKLTGNEAEEANIIIEDDDEDVAKD